MSEEPEIQLNIKLKNKLPFSWVVWGSVENLRTELHEVVNTFVDEFYKKGRIIGDE